jgi:hypothetical protein
MSRTSTIPFTTSSSAIPTNTINSAGAIPVPMITQSTNNSSCNISIPDYTTLRQQNLDKINKYYNTLLSSYTQNYRDYSNQTASSNVNDRTYANTTLKPKVENYNTQIINVSQSMIDNVSLDTDLIMEQKTQLQEKTNQIDTLMNNIKLLKEKDNEMNILTRARNDSLNSTKTGTDDINFYTYIYIGINILMVLSIIGIVIYIVYSNYSRVSEKNIRMNNVHRSIMRQ